MKKPWYIWLSLLGFMGLFFASAVEILIKRRPRDMGLWLQFCGKFILLLFGSIIIPAVMLLVIMGQLSALSGTLGTVMNVVVLLYVYIMGVTTTNYLYQWKRTKLYG